ncbi:hypothetical protein ACIA8O_19810 [Kitasatospora sp. NPDC051853]|uniref:hypothetical protein n=1 Tax=Kitasatospora sp. NPDC051853 TaxID=3364058 RepID=UPI003795AE0C
MTTPPTPAPEPDPTVRLGKQDTPLPLGPVRPAEDGTVRLRQSADELPEETVRLGGAAEETVKLAPADATVRLGAGAGAGAAAGADPELTVRLAPDAAEATVKLSPAAAPDATVKLTPAAPDATVKLTPADPAATVKLSPAAAPDAEATVKLPPGGVALDATTEMTATALTERLDRTPPPTPVPVPSPAPEPTAPDGGLRRFGPGVPPQAAAVWHGAAQQEPPPRPRRRGRWALFLLVLLLALALLGWFAWQRYGRPVAVNSVSVQTGSADLPCDGTQVITAALETDGGAGDVSYRWLRSDGTDSGPLTQRVEPGHHTTQLTLRWSFHGQGTLDATATLQVDAPTAHTSAVSFRYTCP